MPSNLVWSWSLHPNSNISYVFMEKYGLNRKRGHAIIGFNHGLPCYVKNMALGPQSRQKPRPTASVFVYLSPSGHVFNIAWQAMIKTYSIQFKLICGTFLRYKQIYGEKLPLVKIRENKLFGHRPEAIGRPVADTHHIYKNEHIPFWMLRAQIIRICNVEMKI